MVGVLHNERTEYAKKFFEQQEHFREINIINLETILKDISGNSIRVRPDLLMIWHNYQNFDLSIKPPDIPSHIRILWAEVVDTSLQGFPKTNDVRKAIYYTLTWKNLYDTIQLKSSIFGKKIKTEKILKDLLIKHRTHINIDFYYIQDDSIWKCEQIDKLEDCKNFRFEDL